MKTYVIDQVLFFVIGIVCLIVFNYFFLFSSFFKLFCNIVIVLVWIFHCRRLLCLPLDLYCGKEEQTVHYGTQLTTESLDFFNRKFGVYLKFYFGYNEKIILYLPTSINKTLANQLSLPTHDQKITITYYRYSKILCSWKPYIET